MTRDRRAVLDGMQPGRVSATGGSARWRFLALAFALSLVVLAGAWVAVRWAFESPLVAERGVGRAIESIPGLVVEGISGSIATGLSASRVVYENDDVRVVATDVRAAWSRDSVLALIRDLLTRRSLDQSLIALESLTAVRVEITGKAATDERQTLPDSLALPIRFDIRSVRVGDIAYSDPQSRWSIRDVEGRASSDGSRHVAELASLVFDGGTIRGRLRIATASPFELDGELDARGEATEFGLVLAARIAGTLEFPRLSGHLEATRGGAEGSGDFELIASPFADLPISKVSLSTRRLDLAQWNRSWPATSLTVDAEAVMVGERSLSGQLTAVNAAPGTIDASRVPLRELAGRFEISPDTFVLDSVRATTTSGSALRGGGRIAGGRGELRLSTPGLRLTDVDRRLKPLTVSGTGVARLEGEVLAVSAELRHRDYSFAGQATRRGSRIEIARASLASRYGKAEVSGDLDLGGARPFHAKGRLSGFNPADFGAFPPARLNGDFVARGVLEPEPEGDVDVQLANSTLRGQALSGIVSAHLSKQRRFSGKLDLLYGGNRATASGAFGLPGDRLQWMVEAPQLMRIDPRLAGTLAASGTLAGTVSEPELEFTVDGRGIALSDLRDASTGPGGASGTESQRRITAAELHATGRIEFRTQGAFDLRATARKVGALEHRIGTASLTTEGTTGAHRIHLEALVDEGAVAIRANGGWDPATGWSGTLEQASLQRPALTLDHPAPLAIAADRFRFGPARLTFEGSRVELQRIDWAHDALAVLGSFEDLQVARVLKALGHEGDIATDLSLAGRIDVELGHDVRGNIEVSRQGGDVAFVEEGELTAGLHRLSLSIVAPGGGEVVATLKADGERIGNVDGVIRTRLMRREGGWSIGGASPLEGRVNADLRRLSWVNALLPGDFRLRGRAQARMTATGTLGSPKLSGTIAGERLGLRSLQTGLELGDGVLAARLDGSTLILERLEAKGPSGTLMASGRMSAGPDGTAAGRIEFVADALRAVSRPDRVVVVSGSGSIAVDGPKVLVSGRFTADEGRIDLPPAEKPQLSADVVVLRPDIARVQTKSTSRAVAPELDVEFDLGDNFVLRGRGLDTRLAGRIRFGRSNGEITALGSVRTVGGTYLAYDRRLEIERGIITFTGALDNPTLDIRALRTRQQVEAGVLVTGELAAPRIQLISRPDVPDTEKLSWLVLGQGLDKSNRAQGALLQSAALALLSPGGGAGLQSRIAQLFGVDQLSFTSGESLQTGVVTVGKQLTRDLYVSVEQGLAGANSFVQVNFLLGKKWTVSARSGGQENALDVYYTLRFD